MTNEVNPTAGASNDPMALVNASVGDLMAMSGMQLRPGAQERTVAEPSRDMIDAQDEDTPVQRLIELAESRETDVRIALAKRSDLPISALSSLANDRRAEVRAVLAANQATIGSFGEALASDKDRSVLVALASNPAAPVSVLERLAQHRKSEVRNPAIHTLTSRAQSGQRGPMGLPPEMRERAGF